MKVDLNKHEIPCQNKLFENLHSTVLNRKPWTSILNINRKRRNEPVNIIFPIINATECGIPQKIIHFITV